jgi:hypothetical protein
MCRVKQIFPGSIAERGQLALGRPKALKPKVRQILGELGSPGDVGLA